MLRRLRFVLLPCVGDQESPTEGSAADLVHAIPYLLIARIVPPRAVLNEVLATGEDDAGMSGGCRWEPFSLTQTEYEELLRTLSELRGNESVKYVEPPEWVTSFEEWRHWTYEYCYDIPAKHSLAVSRQLTHLEEKKRGAEASGDKARAERLLCQIADISLAHSDWVNQHRQPHIWERKS